jgi:hypothetical protein
VDLAVYICGGHGHDLVGPPSWSLPLKEIARKLMKGSRLPYMEHILSLALPVSVGVWLNVSLPLTLQDQADIQGLLILLFDPPSIRSLVADM